MWNVNKNTHAFVQNVFITILICTRNNYIAQLLLAAKISNARSNMATLIT